MIHDFPSAASRASRNGHSNPPAASQLPPLITADDVQELVKPVAGLIAKYPAAALASAFLIGVALACWIKRK